MKHKRFNLKVCALAALIAGFNGTAVADDRQAALDAQAQAAAELAAVANDRFGTIDGIVAIVEPMLGDYENNDGWRAEFIAALEGATDEQLLALQDATSYDAVRAILQGRDAPVELNGLAGTEALGDLTQDLVFTPVVPCRVFDTRFDAFGGPGGGNPGSILNYHVYGSAALLLPQGHTAGTGCPAPKGEPVAIAANFTVVPYSQGHIRVWPYLAPQPNASFLNYSSTAATNLANAGIIATCFLCPSGGQDISVSTWFGSSDSLGDVMGYFYPAQISPLSDTALHGYDLGQGTISSTNNNVFINPQSGASTFTFSGGEEVLWRTSAMVRRNGGTSNLVTGTFDACYRNTTTNVVVCPNSFAGQTDFCIQSTGTTDQKSVQTAGRVAAMPAGTYEFSFRANQGGNNCGSSTTPYEVWSSKITVIKLKN